MGGGYQLPALDIRPPQPEDPMGNYMRLVQLRNMVQQGQFQQGQMRAQENANQLSQIQIKEAQRQDRERQAVRQSFVQNQGDVDATVKDVSQNPDVSPQTLQQLQLHALDYKTKLDAKSEADLKLHATQVDNFRGLFQPIYDLPADTPPDQLERLYQRQRTIALASPKAYGLDDPQALQQVPDHFPGKEQGEMYMAAMAGTSTQIEQRLKGAQTREAAGKGFQAEQEGLNLQAQRPKIQAEAGVAPQMAQLDVQGKRASIAETQARTRLTNTQQQILTNQPAAVQSVPVHLVGKALDDYQKAGEKYAEAVSAATDMKTFVDMARSGNKIAYAYAPTEGVLTLNTGRDVKRVNMAEISSYGGAGSALDRVQAFFGKQTSGASIPPNVLNDIESLHQAIGANAQTLYGNKLKVINSAYGSKFQPVDLGTGQSGGNLPAGNGKTIDKATGQQFYEAAGHDPAKARQLAIQNGWKVQ
jgi:hypothetical protein